jgi:hypothetical protein
MPPEVSVTAIMFARYEDKEIYPFSRLRYISMAGDLAMCYV